MNKINKYRYLNILFLAIVLIASAISCDDSNNLSLDQKTPEGPVSDPGSGGDVPSDNPGKNDTECIYMQTHTEKINFQVEGTEGLASRDKLKEVEVYFPLSSAKIKDDDIKYNLYLGLSNFKSDLVDNKNKGKSEQAWGCKEIEVGSYKYTPFLDDYWRFFTERPSNCYDVNEKFEILIKNYKSKDCTYEIIYNK